MPFWSKASDSIERLFKRGTETLLPELSSEHLHQCVHQCMRVDFLFNYIQLLLHLETATHLCLYLNKDRSTFVFLI